MSSPIRLLEQGGGKQKCAGVVQGAWQQHAWGQTVWLPGTSMAFCSSSPTSLPGWFATTATKPSPVLAVSS